MNPSFLVSVDAHSLFRPSETFELDRAVDQGEQSIVAAFGHVAAGVYLGAALADEDRPGGDLLPRVSLHAQPLGMAVTTVFRTSYTFFMCHDSLRAPNLERRATIPISLLLSVEYTPVGAHFSAGTLCAASS